MADFTLPELGENITSGDVLRVLVKPGDTVARDQAVLELETDKATIEVPSSVAGRVTAVAVKAGDKVKVGQVILSVEEAQDAAGPTKAGSKPAAVDGTAAKPAGAAAQPEAVEARTSSKVPDGGDEPAEGTAPAAATGQAAARAPEVDPEEQREEVPAKGARPERQGSGRAAAPSGGSNVVDISRGARPSAEPAAAAETPPAPAAPSVRRTARELGVDIESVSGTGPDGRISIEDVKAYAKKVIDASSHAGTGIAAEALPDFSRWGDIERKPMTALRRKTAEHLSAAWATIPHVTQHESADVTALEELRKKYAPQAEAAGANLTVTAIAVKVVAAALKMFPQFNASVDLAAQEIIYKKYVNVGIAVDTDRGLLVPVVRDADAKNIIQLAVEIAQLSKKARERKLSLEEMQGGCFSISNLGGIGGTYFTPIVNAPEVAVLGISRARIEPVYQGSQFVPRLMLPLSLSYDHRAIDGADGMRFLRWVVEALEQPFLIALQG